MKHPFLFSALLALVPAFAVGLLIVANPTGDAEADSIPFRCTENSLYFPASGTIGWIYQDPASTDHDASGNRTAHTGIDVHGSDGPGSPIFAPADGVVSGVWGPHRANIELPGVTNLLTGEPGIEIYLTHMSHNLQLGQTVSAGEVIGYISGYYHVHMSIGAQIGYDDRELSQTQDPSPYFHAALSVATMNWQPQYGDYRCLSAEEPVALQAAPAATETPTPVEEQPAPQSQQQTYVVQPGDTLYGIALAFGVSVEDIAAANGISDMDFLSLGQELVIPGVTATVEDTTPVAEPEPIATTLAEAPSSTASSGTEYVVVDGDTLYGIAEAFGVDVESILALNDIEDPDFLSIGDVLLIP